MPSEYNCDKLSVHIPIVRGCQRKSTVKFTSASSVLQREHRALGADCSNSYLCEGIFPLGIMAVGHCLFLV